MRSAVSLFGVWLLGDGLLVSATAATLGLLPWVLYAGLAVTFLGWILVASRLQKPEHGGDPLDAR